MAAATATVLTGSDDKTVKVWRGNEPCAPSRRTQTRSSGGGAAGRRALHQRLEDKTAKLFTFGGALERTFEVGSWVGVAALVDGAHFVVGLGMGPNVGEVRLYNVDGTLVHTFTGHTNVVRRW